MPDLENNWRKIAKTGESRTENLQSQPLRSHQVFNNPLVVTESWYPTVASRRLRKGKTLSFKIGAQRLVLFRGQDGAVRALDAFCPHMGADLSRGSVDGNEIRCYFHRWKFNAEGHLTEIPCKKKLPFALSTASYPVEEKYGFIWVYSGGRAPYPVPNPIGLENQDVEGRFLLSTQLFVHHHILMASAIDLQHFGSVHGLQADFNLDIQENSAGVFHWNVRGQFQSKKSWRQRLAQFVLGPSFQYDALFAGGSIVSLTYGQDQYFRGRQDGYKLPTFYALWGCRPLANGLSEAAVFIVGPRAKGFVGKIKSRLRFGLTVALLAWLKDDDVKAFPRMRFQTQNLIDQDRSVANLVAMTEKLKRSAWSFEN